MLYNLFYHVTPLSNVPSIRENGLVPGIGHLSKKAEENEPGVYLFPNKECMEDALMGWLGFALDEAYGEDSEIAIVVVKLTDDEAVKLESEADGSFEVISRETIPPEKLSFFTDDMQPLEVA